MSVVAETVPNGGIPCLGVVTVTFNAEFYLRPFLACCMAQQLGNFEILVIDNASLDGTLQLLNERGDKRVQVVANATNIGYAAACNQGIRHFAERRVEDILFLNNDTEFGPELFAMLLDRRRAERADAVTPRITYFDDPLRDWYAGGRFVFWKGFQGTHFDAANCPSRRSPSGARKVDVAPGCCVLFALDTFKKIGLFDPAYFVYFEDTDLFWRMHRAGLRLLYLPGVVIAHKISLSTGGSQSDFSIRYHQRNQVYAIRKHFRRGWVAAQLVILFLKATLRAMLTLDELRQYRLRLRAMREGFSVPLPAHEVQLGMREEPQPF